MAKFEARKIRGLVAWQRVRRLYERAFPAYERKPFAIIAAKRKEGKTDIWCFYQEEQFAGFATTINGQNLVLIDYLAIEESLRGQGNGQRALEELARQYPGKTLFVEIESPFENVPNREERLRRKEFYRRCGYIPSRTMADVYGTKMELMCRGGLVDFSAYYHLLCEEYSPHSRDNIHPLPYPEDCQEGSEMV